jgi:hypothetical protein
MPEARRLTSTEVYERKLGESPAAWKDRVDDALDGLAENLQDEHGDPDRLIITTVLGKDIGYSITITVVRNDRVDTSSEAD